MHEGRGDALQTADKHGVACPADWRPGEKVIVPPATTAEAREAAREENDRAALLEQLTREGRSIL